MDNLHNEHKMINLNEFSEHSWGHCLSIKNELVELVIPFEFGPRLIRYASIGEKNQFAEFPAHKLDLNRKEWHSYGGHRLWHGPEVFARTYLPDNDPVKIEQTNNSVLIQQTMEAPTQLQKEIEVRLDPLNTHVQVTHRIRNHSLFDIRLALWAVSVMATQGKAILPLPPRGSHDDNLQAQTSLNLWAYTDMKDTRWNFGPKLITFKQDPSKPNPQKIGISRSRGWLAYILADQAFIKKSCFIENQAYPDENSALEIYADHKCVELETLSPVTTIEPGDYAELVEDWYLFKGFDANASDNDLDKQLSEVLI
ncbi:MAG: hypothetical protein WCK35_03470 [Chloroflexota bacterium]